MILDYKDNRYPQKTDEFVLLVVMLNFNNSAGKGNVRMIGFLFNSYIDCLLHFFIVSYLLCILTINLIFCGGKGLKVV